MSLEKAVKDMKWDVRLLEKKVASGEITKEELKKHLESLPDLKDKIEIFNLGDDRQRSETH